MTADKPLCFRVQTIYHSCNQNTPTVIPYSGFPMKTRRLHKTRMFHKKKQKHVPRGHVKSLPLSCRAHWRFLAHFCSHMNCGGVADSPPLWTKSFFSLCAAGMFFWEVLRAERTRFKDQLNSELWAILSLPQLMLRAFFLALLECTARGRQTWTSATRARPHVTRRREWHMQCSQRHTRVLLPQQQQ